ncbi:hypothetical protein PAPYR_5033 [Paratrimastix pyriformis]|uniref:Uncharacterized protein n=1 Tax=Paratrimastix pyriformis TaxID=342808 RepID=A0ABQ8ULY1_9EUKA|nr:hypothetical protein PAPYR_5033 [Paratrimastix pyriformis]
MIYAFLTRDFGKSKTNPIAIALCLKNIYPCLDTRSDKDGLAILDEFFAQLQDVITTRGLTVQIVLDGRLSPGTLVGQCLNDRWRQWPATWTGLPWEAGFDNNKGWGHDRLNVFDVALDSPEFLLMAERSWGKFLGGPWPLLVWEPSRAEGITRAVETYVKQGAIHQAGFRVAINVDVAQFQVYAAPLSKQAWQEPLPMSTSCAGPGLFILRRSGDSASEVAIALFRDTALGGALHYRLFDAPAHLAPTAHSAKGPLPLPPPTARGTLGMAPLAAAMTWPSCAQLGPASCFAVLDSAGSLAVYGLPPGSPATPQLRGAASLAAPGPGDAFVHAAALAPSESAGVVVLGLAQTPNCSSGFLVTAHGLPADLNATAPGAGVVPLWARCLPAPVISPRAARALAANWNGSSIGTPEGMSAPPPPTSALERAASIGAQLRPGSQSRYEGIVALSLGGVLYAVALDGDLAAGTPCEFAGQPVAYDVGTGVHLVIQSGVVAEVHPGARCCNTEKRNKSPLRTCTLAATRPACTPGVLGYNVGPLAAWRAHLAAADQQHHDPESGWVTCCHPALMHGVFSMGAQPAVSLLPLPGGGLGLAALQEGWRVAQHSAETAECGEPAPSEGWLVAGWHLDALDHAGW